MKNLIKIESCSSNEQNVEVTELDLNKIESLNENYIEIEKRINETNGWYIGEIENPSNILQLLAVIKNPNVFNKINNPSQTVLDYINNNKKIQHSVIISNPENIKHIRKPTKKQQLIAVEYCPEIINCISNPTLKALKYVVKYKKINKSYKSQLKAVRENGDNLRYMCYKGKLSPHLDEEILIEAIKNNYNAVKWLNFNSFYECSKVNDYILSNEIVLNEILLYDPYFIEEVKSPNRENQLAFINGLKSSKYNIDSIDHLVKEELKIPELIEFENNLMYMCR